MLKTAALIIATSYFAHYLERFETAMVYPFDATHVSPETAGEPRLTETREVTSDGEKLVIWRALAAPGRPTIFYLPGNAGGLKDRAERFRRLIDRGYGIVAVGYRGSSGSTGLPEEDALIADALALASAETAKPLVLYGESLGTAMAIRLAARGIGDAIVLEAPFTSLVELVGIQYPNEDLGHLVTQRWESERHIANVTLPLLIFHGSGDRVVPIDMGRRLFAKAGSSQKHFLEIGDRGHTGLWTIDAQTALYDFLNEAG